MPARRPLAAGGLLAAGLLACSLLAQPAPPTAPAPAPLALTGASHGLATPGGAGAPGYTFVSAPDFLNQDVGDVRSSPTYSGGPNSTNAAYEAALDDVLAEIAGHGAEDLLVAGDLVEGRWGRDDEATGTFGPTRTDAQRARAVRRAAAVYYPDWLERVAAHGLTPYAAVGDHELGDDRWRRRDAWSRFKRRHVGLFRHQFARHVLSGEDGSPLFRDRPARGPARRTAYAVRLDPSVLLVTLDVFERTERGVAIRVDRPQLRWLRGVLSRARRVPWVIVQGHTPVVTPVRHRFSSALSYAGGTRSALWRMMRRFDVDFYFNGEAHATTVHRTHGILQVTHGGLFYRGEMSYLVGRATDSRMTLEVRRFDGRLAWDGKLWSTAAGNGPLELFYDDPSRIVGTLVVEKRRSGGNRVVRRDGITKRYDR